MEQFDVLIVGAATVDEGVTASMVQLDLAVKIVNRLPGEREYLTRAQIWPVNKRQVEAQGKAFADQLATLIGATSSTAGENVFFFQHDVIFSNKALAAPGKGEPRTFSADDLLRMAAVMFGGVLTGKLRVPTIRLLLKGRKTAAARKRSMRTTPQKKQATTHGQACFRILEGMQKHGEKYGEINPFLFSPWDTTVAMQEYRTIGFIPQ